MPARIHAIGPASDSVLVWKFKLILLQVLWKTLKNVKTSPEFDTDNEGTSSVLRTVQSSGRLHTAQWQVVLDWESVQVVELQPVWELRTPLHLWEKRTLQHWIIFKQYCKSPCKGACPIDCSYDGGASMGCAWYGMFGGADALFSIPLLKLLKIHKHLFSSFWRTRCYIHF